MCCEHCINYQNCECVPYSIECDENFEERKEEETE